MTTQTDLEPIARQLLEQAQMLATVRRDLDELANETTHTHADLVSRLDEVNGRSPAETAPAAWCWRSLGPEGQRELQTELSEWVTWLRHRYPLARRVPACWIKHPEVVEELTALWLAWQAAYERQDASPTAPADWHDRWLPGLLHRLEHGPFALPCRDQHQDRPSSSFG